MDTYDCEPTMSDTQVMEFCRQGFLVLEGIVPPEIDSKTLESLDAYYATQPEDLPDRTASIPSDLLAESWFMDHVILHPQVTGVVRSLLGKNFALPTSLSNHRVRCPMPAVVPGRQDYWHRDGAGGVGWSLDDNLVPELERVDFGSVDSRGGAQNCLQVFYYPQDVGLELGPTELVPGSHLIQGEGRTVVERRQEEGRFKVDSFLALLDDCGDARDSYLQAAPSGTITITAYPIWHRRTESTGEGIRNNLKYRYYRTVSPRRDWVIEPGYEVTRPQPMLSVQSQPEFADAADMFQWLSGIPTPYPR